MTNALRKIALPAAIVFFCALIGANAYLASKNLRVMQSFDGQRADASEAHSAIAAIDLDLQHIETGQRGFLLTGDNSYLLPYTEAVQKLPKDFSALRSRLAGRPAQERALESDLEAVTESKIDDADETIRLRQKGYRHRAFLIVDSNRGRDLMDKARALLDSLSQIESSNIARYQQELESSTRTGLRQVVFANLALLLVTVVTLIAFDYRSKRLERTNYQREQELRATSSNLARFTSTLSTDVRETLQDMQAQAENLLTAHGGFLPRQGQEGAEWIYQASRHVSHVIDGLLQPPAPPSVIEQGGHEVIRERRDPRTADDGEGEQFPRSQSA